MARDLAQVDTALNTAEGNIKDIIKELGSVPSQQPKNVFARLKELEDLNAKTRLPGLETRVKALETLTAAHAAKLERFKWYTWGIIGALAASMTLVKIDIQAVKIDFTLFKKVDEKNSEKLMKLHKWTDRRLRGVKDFFFREAARQRVAAEAAAKQEKLKEDAREAEQKAKADRLQRQVNALPPVVNKHTRQIKAIQGTLRSARTAAQGVRGATPDRRGGLDSASPRLGPVTKDVKDLRSAVDQLARSLGAF